MISDSSGALMCRQVLKVSTLHKKCKIERPSENMDLTGKLFEASDRRKEQKQNSRSFKNTKWSTRPLYATIEYSSSNEEEVNRRKLQKAFRKKLL